MYINSQPPVNHTEEEKDAERRKDKARHDLERRQATRAMETFEGKFGEKTALKKITTENAQKIKLQEENKKEKVSLIEKLIQTKQSPEVSEQKNDQATLFQNRAKKIHDEEQFRQENAVDLSRQESEIENNETLDNSVEEKHNEKTEKKNSDVAEDGHRRVVNHQHQSGYGGGSGGNSSGNDSHSGGQSFHSQDQQNQQQSQSAVISFTSKNLQEAPSSQRSFQQSFDQNARQFTKENLDELVSHVQLGLNSELQDFFEVQLNDQYFNGLKIQTTRTDNGVVLQFICPNVSVKSTFLKNRPAVYERLMQKGIKVFRIDIV